MAKMDYQDFDSQFAEKEDETRDRWLRIKAKRRADGKCWQCAKPVTECLCPNVNHGT